MESVPQLEAKGRLGERRLDDRGVLLRDFEGADASARDEQRPATRADHERDRNVRFVVRALDLSVGLDLHRAELPSVVDRVLVNENVKRDEFAEKISTRAVMPSPKSR